MTAMRTALYAAAVLVTGCTLGAGCTVGDRYLVAGDHFTAVQIMTPTERERHAVVAHRAKNGQEAYVRANSFSLGEAVPRSDGRVAVPTRLPSRRIKVGNALVWVGTPLSIAGLLMVILGHDAVRWSGIALAAVAEPVMIAGTVLWVQGSNAHPQEVARGISELTYLPELGQPASPTR